MKTIVIYVGAALCEIAGCYSLWAVLKLGKSPLWLVPGAVCLGLFAWLLTRVDTPAAGRAFAAYGAIYIAASLAWMGLVERRNPDAWDLGGLLLCLAGAGVILFAPRGA